MLSLLTNAGHLPMAGYIASERGVNIDDILDECRGVIDARIRLFSAISQMRAADAPLARYAPERAPFTLKLKKCVVRRRLYLFRLITRPRRARRISRRPAYFLAIADRQASIGKSIFTRRQTLV